MYLKDQQFDNIIHHARALDFWEQEYNQLSESIFQSRLQDLNFYGFRIFREQMNCRVAQRTKTPPDTINILIPVQIISDTNHLPTHMQYAHGAILLPSQDNFFFCTPPDTDYIVISLHQSALEKRLIDQDMQQILQKRFGCGIALNSHISVQLIQKCTRILNQYGQGGTLPDLRTQQMLCDEIIDLILHYFNTNENISSTRYLGSNHHHIVQYVYERILESDHHVSLIDLCQELQIPHRSLHYAFNKTIGISPNKYIRAIRLNAADRMIHKGKELITDIAYQYGFSHSSHFGREYKKLFGRIPSHIRFNYI